MYINIPKSPEKDKLKRFPTRLYNFFTFGLYVINIWAVFYDL